MKQKKSQCIIFTGGGSGGHVMPAITIIQEILDNYPDFKVQYIGSKNGIEKNLIQSFNEKLSSKNQGQINYKAISTGKLRRYLSFENLTDIFKILLGIVQSFFFMLRFHSSSTVVFATGGFVCVPVVVGAFLTGKKIFCYVYLCLFSHRRSIYY